MPADLAACAGAARTWLADRAVPLWSGAGVLADGMFAEAIGADGAAVAGPRRVRVQARQIYAFCELGRLGLAPGWRGVVEPALALLLERGARPDGLFVHRFDADGRVLDPRADLYDSAFMLFALGHAARALGRPELLARAERLMRRIEAEWSHPQSGFAEGELAGAPRRQNPHMHLFEAAMLLWRVSGNPAWQVRAGRLAALATAAFIEPASGALTEYFADDWGRAGVPDADLVEPGHCLEWSSLLDDWRRCGGEESDAGDRLVGFARAHGQGGPGETVVNAVDLDGRVLDGGARLWPQAERLRAALRRWRRTADPAEAAEAVAAHAGLAAFLDRPVAGAWRDRTTAQGDWVDEPAPASAFYHIVGALSELIRATGIGR